MSSYNGLPGFDAWLTHNPLDDLPEPSLEDIQQAEKDLGPWASDEQVWEQAYRVMECRRDHAYEDHLASKGDDT